MADEQRAHAAGPGLCATHDHHRWFVEHHAATRMAHHRVGGAEIDAESGHVRPPAQEPVVRSTVRRPGAGITGPLVPAVLSDVPPLPQRRRSRATLPALTTGKVVVVHVLPGGTDDGTAERVLVGTSVSDVGRPAVRRRRGAAAGVVRRQIVVRRGRFVEGA